MRCRAHQLSAPELHWPSVVAVPTPAIYICPAMLFLGAAPLPYGYYTLLRLVRCGTFTFAAYVSFNRGSKAVPWVFVLVAVTFNPVVKVHLPKEIWAIVDVAAGLLLLATSKHIKST
jgi:hypothetical protein